MSTPEEQLSARLMLAARRAQPGDRLSMTEIVEGLEQHIDEPHGIAYRMLARFVFMLDDLDQLRERLATTRHADMVATVDRMFPEDL